MNRTTGILHRFSTPVSHLRLPEKFTYPFHYTPHPLCVIAADEIQEYIRTQEMWQEELQHGKMFGILIVKDTTGGIGYLAAFSGNIAGKSSHPYFVPPIYDLSEPNGFFKPVEKYISIINDRIEMLQTHPALLRNKQLLKEETEKADKALAEAKEAMKTAKAARESRRLNNPDETELAALIKESQFQKAELKRMEREWKSRIAAIQREIDVFTNEIAYFKDVRKDKSIELQQRLFDQYHLFNAREEIKSLCDIFEQTVHRAPPAGAGECAAPKLLQYAYLHQLKPVAMAEFWWGNSPVGEIRKHGYFYPACKGKCEPILKYMLQGLDVEENPLAKDVYKDTELEIVYEDEWLLIVNKPAGMLSVPGKTDTDSVEQRMRSMYPDATGPMIVHRLDMATSGLLLVAKTKEVHQHLQAQFENRTIKKRYVALLDGIPVEKKGTINLPLRPDLHDRPRQVVDREQGKAAITDYQVISHTDSQTRIAFYPLTGRTHQLRVHSAHPEGLNCPITGDELYGKKAERLYLHAEAIEFVHPASGKIIRMEKKAGF